MSELLVVSIFATRDPRNLVWAELQRRFLMKTTRRAFDYRVVLNGTMPELRERFDRAEILAESPSVREHHDFLHTVVDHCRTTDHRYHLILDSDAFPVCEGWDDALVELMQRWEKQIAAPIRFENHDTFPHPCAFFCTAEGMRDPRIDFVPRDYQNLLGRMVRDTGSAMAKLEVLPLIRTNVVSPHPLFGAIYQHLFYHHGAGSRGVGTRLLRSGTLDHVMDDGEHRRVTSQLFDELDGDQEAFVCRLMGREGLPVYTAPPPALDSPDLYPVSLDLERGTTTLRRMTREAYREASFLDDRTPSPTSDRDRVVSLHAVAAQKLELRPIRWVLHTAFVGSTLLSRCLDVPGRTIVYREPAFLTEIADHDAFDLMTPERRVELVRSFAALMSRTYQGEVPIVKAHDRVNALAPDLLSLHPESRALVIYADLETFLLATLKSPTRRRFIRRTWNAVKRSDLSGPFAVKAAHAADHELAAALWLMITSRAKKIVEVCGDRVRSLDCRRLFEEPERTVHSCADFFALDIARAELEAVMAGGVLSTYAKGSRPYDSELRSAEMNEHKERLGRELAAAYEYLEQLAPGTDRAPVLGHALT
jgi:hypothetical protein